MESSHLRLEIRAGDARDSHEEANEEATGEGANEEVERAAEGEPEESECQKKTQGEEGEEVRRITAK